MQEYLATHYMGQYVDIQQFLDVEYGLRRQQGVPVFQHYTLYDYIDWTKLADDLVMEGEYIFVASHDRSVVYILLGSNYDKR